MSRSLGQLLRLSVYVAVLAALGCDDDRAPPREPEVPPRPPPRASASSLPEELAPLLADAGSAPDGAAARSVLSDLRRDKLSLAARRTPPQRLAFARGRLARLSHGELIVLDTKTWKQIAKQPVADPRRVVGLRDGSLLVAAAQGITWLHARKDESMTAGRVPLFPDSVVLPDRREKRRFWVLHGFDPTLYGYELTDEGKLETLDFIDLVGFDKNAFVSLKDGSYLYTTAEGLRRFFPGGKREDIALEGGGDIWRLATTRRLDRVWLARENGRFELLELGRSKARQIKSLELGDALDVAANDTYLAILTLTKPADGKRKFSLRVVDDAGKEQLEAELPVEAPPGSGESWVQEMTKNRALHLAPDAPLIAVGGPDSCTVWNVKTKKNVFTL